MQTFEAGSYGKSLDMGCRAVNCLHEFNLLAVADVQKKPFIHELYQSRRNTDDDAGMK